MWSGARRRLPATKRSCARCTSEPTGAAFRRLLDERHDAYVSASCRRARGASGESSRSAEFGGDHRALHRQAGKRTARFALGSGCLRRRIPRQYDRAMRSSVMPRRLATSCDHSCASSCGSSPRRAREAAVRPSCRIRSGTRFFARCCTSACAVCAQATPSQGRRCARTGACGRFARIRDRACDALRARSRAWRRLRAVTPKPRNRRCCGLARRRRSL